MDNGAAATAGACMPASIVALVDKLVALAAEGSGATEEEARTAAVQACRLIARHGLALMPRDGSHEGVVMSPLQVVEEQVL